MEVAWQNDECLWLYSCTVVLYGFAQEDCVPSCFLLPVLVRKVFRQMSDLGHRRLKMSLLQSPHFAAGCESCDRKPFASKLLEMETSEMLWHFSHGFL